MSAPERTGAGLRPRRRRRAFVVTVALCAWCSLALAVTARMGTDLSAAYAHADFAAGHGLAPVDFRWYGGVQQFGYSLLSQFVMAWIGVLTTGVLAAGAASLAFADLLTRGRVRRPVLASAAGTLCLYANLVSGRVTYALGLALGLLALCAVVRERPRTGAALGVLAAAASPVAALFLGLAGVALWRTGDGRSGRTSASRTRAGRLLAFAAAAPLVLEAVVFGQGGYNTMSFGDAASAVLLCVGVLALCPHRVVRAGAALCAAGLLAAYVVHTPVGLNATRLPVMFAIPVVLATARLRLPMLVVPLLALAVIAPPVVAADYRDRGSPASAAAYYRPLLGALADRHPTGRVEVPPLRDYWESVYVADAVPLARGWLRQVDTDRNALFFDGNLTADRYRAWLTDNGVAYVALADATPSWVGREETRLVRSGLTFLTPVWTGAHWRLYAVAGGPALAGSPALADPPARVVSADAVGLTLTVDGPADVLVRVRWSRFLTLRGPPGCLAPAGRWVRLSARSGGTYRISSALQLRTAARC